MGWKSPQGRCVFSTSIWCVISFHTFCAAAPTSTNYTRASKRRRFFSGDKKEKERSDRLLFVSLFFLSFFFLKALHLKWTGSLIISAMWSSVLKDSSGMLDGKRWLGEIRFDSGEDKVTLGGRKKKIPQYFPDCVTSFLSAVHFLSAYISSLDDSEDYYTHFFPPSTVFSTTGMTTSVPLAKANLSSKDKVPTCLCQTMRQGAAFCPPHPPQKKKR